MRIVLFDIDGTLIRAGGASQRAIHTAFIRLFGVGADFSGVEFHGSTDPLITQAIARRTLGRELSESEGQALTEAYLAHLGPELARETAYEILPGVPELVRDLAQRDTILLGLQTGNIAGAVPHKLARAGLDGVFRFGGFGSDSPERTAIVATAIERAIHLAGRRHARPEDVVVIGDTPRDVVAGQACGATTIAVATGKFTRPELALTGPTLTADTLAEDTVRATILG